MASKAMAPEGPAIPHLSKGEVADLRSDIDDAFELVETPTAKVTLTATQIKALAATPVELVAAPGANKLLELKSVMLRLTNGSEVLAEAGDNLAVKYTDGTGVQVCGPIEMTGFIDQATPMTTRSVPTGDAIVANDADVDAALVLHNLGSEFTGNVSNDAALDVYTEYRIHNLS